MKKITKSRVSCQTCSWLTQVGFSFEKKKVVLKWFPSESFDSI